MKIWLILHGKCSPCCDENKKTIANVESCFYFNNFRFLFQISSSVNFIDIGILNIPSEVKYSPSIFFSIRQEIMPCIKQDMLHRVMSAIYWALFHWNKTSSYFVSATHDAAKWCHVVSLPAYAVPIFVTLILYIYIYISMLHFIFS